MPFSPINETWLHYERSGSEEPLVLIHGSWVDGRVWDAVRPALSRSFEVVSFDRRGHSRSVPAPAGTIHEDVDDVAGLIEALGLRPAHVAGASWGGSIALRLAAARPDLLRSLSVHEPPLFDLLDVRDWPELAELRYALASVAQLLDSGDPEDGARLYFDRIAAAPGGWAGFEPAQRMARAALLRRDQAVGDACRSRHETGHGHRRRPVNRDPARRGRRSRPCRR